MKTYLSIWRQFNKFLVRLDKRPDSWEDRLSLFGAHLVDSGYQSSTLRSYFSGIRHMLKADGYHWDENKIFLNTLVRACKIQDDKRKTRLPISFNLLELMLFELQRIFSRQPYLEALYVAMFCLGYYGLMRVGELTSGSHPVLAADVNIAKTKDKILVVLRTSKTHTRSSKPQKIKISASNTGQKTHSRKVLGQKFFCPFKALRRYATLRGGFVDETEPFFVFSDHSPVRPEQMRQTLRLFLHRLGLREELYDCQSLRIGRASDLLFKFKLPIERIKILGRWRSNVVYKYLRS